MNKKHKLEISAFYDLYKKEKGDKMKITEELAKIENIIDVLPHQINPCKICDHAKNWVGDSADFDMEYCSFCCWYYDSYFKMGAINEIYFQVR